MFRFCWLCAYCIVDFRKAVDLVNHNILYDKLKSTALATRMLYFLKQLNRSGLTSKQLFNYYAAVVRPVLEYCGPVWHYALTKSQTQQLGAIQKRAIQIVLNFSRGMPYTSMLFAADLNSLVSRREDISLKCFQGVTKSTSCVYHFLPDPKLPSYISRLRSYEKFLRPYTRIKQYRSFVQYALSHYQDRVCND